MNEKKTVLFLMNGFGVEASKSFEVYSKELMPTFEKLIAAYPFKLLYASGEMIGNNRSEASNFKDGYSKFGAFGNVITKYDILKKKIDNNEFLNNPVVNNSIDIAVNNKSRLHVMFSLGNKVNKDRYEQLNSYLELAKTKGIEDVYVHLILGDSSVNDLKIANTCIRDFRNRVIRYYPKTRIASICGGKYAKDGNQSDIANFYRMMVSGVGEVWTDYEATINKKFSQGMTDDSINGFVTVKENLLKNGDSLFMFTYGNNIGVKFLTTVLNPKKFFPTSNVPEQISVNALFNVEGMTSIPYAFEDELPDISFLDNIPEDKKLLIMATKDRIPYITTALNAGKKEFKNNINIWPIEDKTKRFDNISQYLAAYINQDTYDLIIVDCQLYEPDVDERTIDQIKNNMKELDKCINIIYSQIIDKNYRFIISSLFGIRYSFKLTSTMELVNLSEKTPFLLIDKEIRKVDLVFKSTGSIVDISKVIAISFGSTMKNGLISIGGEDTGKGKLSGQKLLIIIAVAALLVVGVLYLYKMLGIL